MHFFIHSYTQPPTLVVCKLDMHKHTSTQSVTHWTLWIAPSLSEHCSTGRCICSCKSEPSSLKFTSFVFSSTSAESALVAPFNESTWNYQTDNAVVDGAIRHAHARSHCCKRSNTCTHALVSLWRLWKVCNRTRNGRVTFPAGRFQEIGAIVELHLPD